MPNNKCLKIIFNLKKRESYLKRYFLLLQQYPINFDILLINDLGTTVNFDAENTLETKIIYSQSKRDITGMNSIFKAIYDNKENLKNYKYIFFVEDDNFIFPDSINECVKFLENNKNFIGCNGNSFLFTKGEKFFFLNPYIAPCFNSKNLISRAKDYNKNYGLTYYSVIETNTFVKICEEISLISDDCLSEIFFNFLTLIHGNLMKLNKIYLAREYPRPPVYNVPTLDMWIKNKNIIDDIQMIILRIKLNLKKLNHQIDENLFLELTLFWYLRTIRFSQSSRLDIMEILNKKLKKIYYSYHNDIRFFIHKLNLIK